MSESNRRGQNRQSREILGEEKGGRGRSRGETKRAGISHMQNGLGLHVTCLPSGNNYLTTTDTCLHCYQLIGMPAYQVD